jgi:predicted membrane GTPase involved in stress response
MAGKDTFSISRTELRRVLTAYKVSEASIQKIFSEMEKAHRHINVVAFVGLLEKSAVSRANAANILRRLGMNDVMINDMLNMADEQKTIAESGRIYDATVEFG